MNRKSDIKKVEREKDQEGERQQKGDRWEAQNLTDREVMIILELKALFLLLAEHLANVGLLGIDCELRATHIPQLERDDQAGHYRYQQGRQDR